MALKRPKQKGTAKKKKVQAAAAPTPAPKQIEPDEERDPDEYHSEEEEKPWLKAKQLQQQEKAQPLPSSAPPAGESPGGEGPDADDPDKTIPLPRYNAMLAVLRNNLYIYGGIFERGSREYTLDDFHLLQLDKLERYVCLKPTDVVIPKDEPESSSDEGSDSDNSDSSSEDEGDRDERSAAGSPTKVLEDDSADEREPEAAAEKPDSDSIRAQATAFMGVSKDQARSAEDVISTPLPGETLAMFYARSREYWAQKAHQSSDNRGKMLRRDGFSLAQERYTSYKPILEEVEKILAEAGLDEEEMRRSAAAGPDARQGQSRNRR